MKKIFLNWVLVIFWMAVIYYLSHQPNLGSGLEPLWDLIFRKIAHVAEYFVLAYLLFRAFQSHGFKPSKALIFTAILAIMYAGFDEWHQSFISMREGKILDVLVDSVGIFIFVILNFNIYGKNLSNSQPL